MGVVCAYVDDAGNTGANILDRGQPYHFVGAILINNDRWLEVRGDLQRIRDGLPHGIGRHPRFEFRGHSIFSGHPPWDQLSVPERMTVYNACIDVMANRDLHLVYGCCNKSRLRGYAFPMHPHGIGLWLCLERIAAYVNYCAQTDATSIGFIVADASSRDINRMARDVLADYRKKGPPFGRPVDMSRIMDVIHLVNSEDCPHLQLCDLSMYALRRYHVANDNLGGIVPKVEARVRASRTFPY